MSNIILFVAAFLLMFGVGRAAQSFFKVRKVFNEQVQALRTCHPRRWIVGGMMGSGKSTFAKSLSNALGVQHIEIDQYPSAKEVLDEAALAETVGWIAEANPWQIPRVLYDNAEIIVFLDYDNIVNYVRLLTRGLNEWRQQDFSWVGFKTTIVDRTIMELGRIVFLHGKSNRAGWNRDGLIQGITIPSAKYIRCTSPAELKQLEKAVVNPNYQS